MNDEIRRPDVHQEEDTISWSKLLLGALASLAIMTVLIVAAWGSLKASEASVRPSGVFPEERLGPRRAVTEVQVDLFGDRGFGQVLNDKKRRELSTFGWVDRERRRVRVPIDVAMDLVVEEKRR